MKNIGRAILEGWKGDAGKRNLKAAEEAYEKASSIHTKPTSE
jgi:Pyruvate/2-oxoacid:ferredoxin oxidoreductase gamma subunit